MPKQKSRTRRKAAPQNLVEYVHDLVEEQSQELPPIYRPPVRRRKARQAAPENLSVRETNTKQSSVPTANDITDALFLKFQSSGVQLVKDNTAVPINDLTGMLSSSSIQPENSSTTDSQAPLLAVFQPPISSDPNINTPSDGTNHAKYSLSPRECYAHRKGDLDSIKIWECIDTVVDPNIIDQSVWKSDTEVTDATSVSIPMYAFKFVDSEDLFIECSAMVCVNPSSQCTLDTCASTTTTTTFSPTGARKRRGVHTSNDKINITIRHASVSLEVKDLSFNKSSGLASTWYAYLVPAYFVICARLYL